MNNVHVKDALDRARSEAQDLHKNIAASMTKNDAAIRASLADIATHAQSLGASVKAAASEQRADAKQHLDHAASALGDTAKHAKAVAAAADGDIKREAGAALTRSRQAIQNLTEAVAAKRKTAKS